MSTLTDSSPVTTSVVIIGAGMSGLAMAHRFLSESIDFLVLEKAQEVGGTWRDNVYPGLFVDIPSQDYQMKFWPKYDWDRAFASGPELQRYLVELTDGLGLRERIQFSTEIVDASWDGTSWELTSRDGRTIRCTAVVAATGFLHHPTLAPIVGLDSFTGASFHSSQWPEDLDVTGKRVAVVGTGSSGIQITTALGMAGVEVTQFVRTPQWIEICENPELSDDDRAQLAEDPDRGEDVLRQLREGINQDERLRNPAWKLAPGAMRENAQEALRGQLNLIADPELRALLTPDYEPGCKRIPKSQKYFEAVQRANVRIVGSGVARVEGSNVIAEDGTEVTADVLVLATGFQTHAYVRPMAVTGLDGLTLDDVWNAGPESYRGVSVPGFPNFFLMHGPFSPVNNVPVPWTIEHEGGYITELVRQALDARVATMPTPEALHRFTEWVGAALPGTVWELDCDSWYKVGNRALVWPWFEKEHREMFEDVRMGDLMVWPLDASTSSTSEVTA